MGPTHTTMVGTATLIGVNRPVYRSDPNSYKSNVCFTIPLSNNGGLPFHAVSFIEARTQELFNSGSHNNHGTPTLTWTGPSDDPGTCPSSYTQRFDMSQVPAGAF